MSKACSNSLDSEKEIVVSYVSLASDNHKSALIKSYIDEKIIGPSLNKIGRFWKTTIFVFILNKVLILISAESEKMVRIVPIREISMVTVRDVLNDLNNDFKLANAKSIVKQPSLNKTKKNKSRCGCSIF